VLGGSVADVQAEAPTQYQTSAVPGPAVSGPEVGVIVVAIALFVHVRQIVGEVVAPVAGHEDWTLGVVWACAKLASKRSESNSFIRDLKNSTRHNRYHRDQTLHIRAYGSRRSNGNYAY
jgi:hypothetical protein